MRACAAVSAKSDRMERTDALTELVEAINRSLAAATEARKATRSHEEKSKMKGLSIPGPVILIASEKPRSTSAKLPDRPRSSCRFRSG
jgi:hypothetical protein